MISYETVRRQFKGLNITIGILYALNAFFALLAIIGAFGADLVLNTPEVVAQYTPEQLAAVELSSTPFAKFVFVLMLVMTIVISVLAFINNNRASKQNDDKISYLVYYIGIAWAILSVVLEFLILGRIALLAPVYMLIFGFLHVFTLRKAQTLKEKTDQ